MVMFASVAAWRKTGGCLSTHPPTMQRSDAAIFIAAVTTLAAAVTIKIAIGIEATAAFTRTPQLASEAPPSLQAATAGLGHLVAVRIPSDWGWSKSFDLS